MKNGVTVSRIIDFLGQDVKKIYGEYSGIIVSHLADVEHVNEETLDWISSHRINKLEIAGTSKARVIILEEDIDILLY